MSFEDLPRTWPVSKRKSLYSPPSFYRLVWCDLSFFRVLHGNRGDVVLNINGKEVGNVKDVLSEIGLDVGKTIDLTVRRNGDHLKLTFTTAPETARPTK